VIRALNYFAKQKANKLKEVARLHTLKLLKKILKALRQFKVKSLFLKAATKKIKLR
jgi:hypothetical protein